MEAKSKANRKFISINLFLDENFINTFKWKQPKWDEFEYQIFKRYYAHYIEEEDRTEEFWETLKRVVEGCFSIQKEHCINLGLPWDNQIAQRSAQLMFQKMWHFKFLDPGRYMLKFSETLLKYSNSVKKCR